LHSFLRQESLKISENIQIKRGSISLPQTIEEGKRSKQKEKTQYKFEIPNYYIKDTTCEQPDDIEYSKVDYQTREPDFEFS